jgi:hypothetical protein
VPIYHRASELRCHRGDDGPSLWRSCVPEDSGQAGGALLRHSDSARSIGNSQRTHGTVHFAVDGHERFARQTANCQLQGVDAKRPRALVGRASAGHSYIRALVCAAFSRPGAKPQPLRQAPKCRSDARLFVHVNVSFRIALVLNSENDNPIPPRLLLQLFRAIPLINRMSVGATPGDPNVEVTFGNRVQDFDPLKRAETALRA